MQLFCTLWATLNSHDHLKNTFPAPCFRVYRVSIFGPTSWQYYLGFLRPAWPNNKKHDDSLVEKAGTLHVELPPVNHNMLSSKGLFPVRVGFVLKTKNYATRILNSNFKIVCTCVCVQHEYISLHTCEYLKGSRQQRAAGSCKAAASSSMQRQAAVGSGQQ